MDEAGSRLGAKRLAAKERMDISESAINKNLRFVQALIKKNIKFSDIPDLTQSLDAFYAEKLGYLNYAMISKDSNAGMSGMTVEQIRKLLS